MHPVVLQVAELDETVRTGRGQFAKMQPASGMANDSKPTSQGPLSNRKDSGNHTLKPLLVLLGNSFDSSLRSTSRIMVLACTTKMPADFHTSIPGQSGHHPFRFGQSDFDRFDEMVSYEVVFNVRRLPLCVLTFIGHDAQEFAKRVVQHVALDETGVHAQRAFLYRDGIRGVTWASLSENA